LRFSKVLLEAVDGHVAIDAERSGSVKRRAAS
jgi:hypothetical protein